MDNIRNINSEIVELLLKPLAVSEYKQNVKQIGLVENITDDRHRYPETSSFTNRVIRYYGDRKFVPEASKTFVADNIEAFTKTLLQRVAQADSRFCGDLVPCGSYYEGVKVKYPNEFDYIWELDPHGGVSMSNLNLNHIKPDTFKPAKQHNVFGRTYFKLGFHYVPPNWQRNYSNCQDLNARIIQEEFRAIIEQVATKEMGNGKTAHGTTSGPAVTLFTKLDSDKAGKNVTKKGKSKLRRHGINFFLVKIDIALAIRVDLCKNDTRLSFLDNCSELAERVDKICHFVTSGDYWRLSFSKIETEKMKELTGSDKNRKHCFTALKAIRDQLSLTADHEPGLLGTYPLKVTFPKENKQYSQQDDWEDIILGKRANNILSKVAKDGEEGRLTSYFVENDPILLESDRSYLESKRMQQYIQELGQQYNINRDIHGSLF